MTLAASNPDGSYSEPLVLLQRAIQPDTVLEVLNEQWTYAKNRQAYITDCEIDRVFPRGSSSYVIKYILTLQSGDTSYDMTVFGELQSKNCTEIREKVIEKLRKSRRKQLSHDTDTDAIASIPKLNMLLRVPGYDEKLPGLSVLHQPKKAKKILASLFNHDIPKDAKVETTILNHRLGKRCVMRVACTTPDNHYSSVLRCLKQHTQQHIENWQHMLKLWSLGFNQDATDHIRIPRVLGYDDTLTTVILEDVPGEILGETTRWPLTQQSALAGAAIAKLHATPMPLEKHHSAKDELKMLDSWVSLTHTLRPDLSRQLCDAYAAVKLYFKVLPAVTPMLSHRDFYGKQLLYDGEQTILIDFDTLCMADPALDIGNFLAHRELAAISGEAVDPDEETAFLSAYKERRSLPATLSISIWKHAALLRLACLYSMHTGWEQVPVQLLDMIESD